MTTKLTETQRKALLVIAANDITTPKQFALLMWPDSHAWRASNSQKRGFAMSGGAYLAKLRKRGLITGTGRATPYRLTIAALSALASSAETDGGDER
jgi:hypothetical protein